MKKLISNKAAKAIREKHTQLKEIREWAKKEQKKWRKCERKNCNNKKECERANHYIEVIWNPFFKKLSDLLKEL